MKVLIICDYYPPCSYGGAGVIAKQTFDNLQKRDYHVKVITTSCDARKEKNNDLEIARVLTPKEKWLDSGLVLFFHFTKMLKVNLFLKPLKVLIQN